MTFENFSQTLTRDSTARLKKCRGGAPIQGLIVSHYMNVTKWFKVF